ncbi:uncharacterized protein A1O5_00467 [Cladophialophora psammophila CBS 110553]|uniref:Uncharacterized protein n=1 Tax=Cladophialophora psammophila CBS 110553 TaxID=1182543 RepID=W9Y0E8_9EURO|nr:uncharacterized protein A1O5_00467 [Cladophialophora psammophila CBS 110553]EXJ75959.1 hypothetical protein A1O5_00467 [Cladophialophora psammophila CBS 110553]
MTSTSKKQVGAYKKHREIMRRTQIFHGELVIDDPKFSAHSPALNVYCVQGLKVADLSIVPEIVVANTENTALLVREKAVSIILRELGLLGEGDPETEHN